MSRGPSAFSFQVRVAGSSGFAGDGAAHAAFLPARPAPGGAQPSPAAAARANKCRERALPRTNRGRRSAVGGLLFLASLLVGCELDQPSTWVAPRIGTDGHGHVYPGATVPFGMVQLSPDNGRGGWDWTSGYHWSDSIITGFSHTHLSGTGIGDLADIQVMPVVDRQPLEWRPPERPEGWEPDPEAEAEEVHPRPPWASSFVHERETAEPGYYAVTLDDSGICAELTATTRTGLHRYSYPADAPRPGLIIDLAFNINWDSPTDTYLEVIDDTTVVGHRFSTGWATDQKTFFAMKVSEPVEDVELLDALAPGGEPNSSSNSNSNSSAAMQASLQGEGVRAWLGFPPATQSVVLWVGMSYVDAQGALSNLDVETSGRSFDEVRVAARDLWDDELGRVRVRGGDVALKRTFYTALYRTKLAPVVFNDVDGRYRGADGEIHTARGFTKYVIYSLWDTFRAQHPLLTITDPERVDDLVESMLGFGRESGWLPVWSLVGNETNTMTGYHAVPVIADAYLKGFRGFDAGEALEAMTSFSERGWRGLDLYRRYGYVPSELEGESVTKTLEYAYDDAAIARMAAALGRDGIAAEHAARASSWTNVLDTWTGFMRGRTAAGDWVEPFDPLRSEHRENTDYTEGNAWQHTWFVPQDVRGLIDRMGGDQAFVAKLDALFEQDTVMTGENQSADVSGMIGQYAHGNEPSHHIAYLYSYAGAPWKTQSRVRQILHTQYDDSPAGLAGNEDCGQMSAWYVFGALGFYPVDPVGGVYVLGSPLFPRVTIDVGQGRTFTVIAEDASAGNAYVQWAELNGEPYRRAWIRHEDVVAGGVLRLQMGPEPNQAWGSRAVDRPPSAWYGAAPPSPGMPGSPPSDNAAADGDSAMAARVKGAFLHAWNGYRTYAWGHDELRPLSRTGRDWYDHTLLMTPIDAYDTMRLMGLDEEAAGAKALILDSLSFDRDMEVQVFEVTIRVLGGLLAAYQIDQDTAWLRLAVDLADRMMPAFGSATGMPYRMVNLRTGAVSGRVNNPAEIGTLTLEFGTVSRLTGDAVYYDAVKRAVTAVYERRSDIGLVGTTIDVETGEWRNTDSHVGGRIDSYYEYLLKAALLFDDDDFQAMYDSSMAALNTYLADERPDGLWYGRADMQTGQRTATRFGALEAFMPGMLALGGDLDRAERLMQSVYRMWLEHGIEPEQIDYAERRVRYPAYILRPEAIESAYVLHAFTGKSMYRDMGRVMISSVLDHTRNDVAYAELGSVLTMEQRDAMQSFFLAETLKYAWLLFAPADGLDFREVVFNTEAHGLGRGGVLNPDPARSRSSRI